MHANPVVARAAEIKAAKRLHYAADDARDWPEVTRTGLILTNLELTERDIAPTSNGCAGQKLRNVAADWRREWFPMDAVRRFARVAVRLAGKTERGEITPRDLRTMRALMPIALLHDFSD